MQLNLPKYDIKIRQTDGKRQVFDPLRRKWVALTPEEFVRQHFVNHLTTDLNYPSSLLANEVELTIAGKRMRCDSVLYDARLQPKMIVEYKAPTVKITQHVFDQISTYNLLLHVDYLIVSNGMSHYCCKMDYDNNTYVFLDHIPAYSEL